MHRASPQKNAKRVEHDNFVGFVVRGRIKSYKASKNVTHLVLVQKYAPSLPTKKCQARGAW